MHVPDDVIAWSIALCPSEAQGSPGYSSSMNSRRPALCRATCLSTAPYSAIPSGRAGPPHKIRCESQEGAPELERKIIKARLQGR